MNQIGWVILAVILAVLLDLYFVGAWRRYRQIKQDYENVGKPISRWEYWKRAMVPAQNNPQLTSIRKRTVDNHHLRKSAWLVIELILIALWAVWVCRDYFDDFFKFIWPVGREFGIQIYAHHFWVDVIQCGTCALWNGSINGGAPALADPFGSAFHPVVMLTTLLFGVVNGVKIAVVISLWLAGLAQWWIAKTLETGRLARLWSSMIVVVSGHLLGRMELGAFGLVLSMASVSLVLASALWLAKSKQKRDAVLLAITFALALVAGHGYLQLGLIALAPAFLFLLFDKNWKVLPIWRYYLLAFGLSILLAGVFLIPVLHFSPNIEKFTDGGFESAQPFAYIPLNLVIDDWDYMNFEILGKFPFPYLYNILIGWWPVVLAILSLFFIRRDKRPILWTLVIGVPIILFTASATPFRWLVDIIPSLAGVRHVPLIAGLVVPLLLGLAAYSFDELIKIDWPEVVFMFKRGKPEIRLSAKWLLIIPTIWSISVVYDFNQVFLATERTQDLYNGIHSMTTSSTQWVEIPFGDHWWVEPALDSGLKLTNVVAPWWWEGRDNPEPYLMVRLPNDAEGEEIDPKLIDKPIFRETEHSYAFIEMDNTIKTCHAFSNGGHITVKCNTDFAGKVTRYGKYVVWLESMDGWRTNQIGRI